MGKAASPSGGIKSPFINRAYDGCMVPLVKSSFDVAIWFLERARAGDSYLQPRKLHHLMFLAQAHYAAANKGALLMPSVFVMGDSGPLEPNVFRALEHGRPKLTEESPSSDAATFLDAIWLRYGPKDVEWLDEMISDYGKDELVVKKREGDEISIAAMARMFAKPAESMVEPTHILRSQAGRAVTVEKWVPGAKPTSSGS